jgi:hypothetical protein
MSATPEAFERESSSGGNLLWKILPEDASGHARRVFVAPVEAPGGTAGLRRRGGGGGAPGGFENFGDHPRPHRQPPNNIPGGNW